MHLDGEHIHHHVSVVLERSRLFRQWFEKHNTRFHLITSG